MLAQGQPAAQADPGDPNAGIRLIGWIAVSLIIAYFMFVRPQKRKEQEMRSLVGNLKENDRVVTIGGIHGVVTNVQRDHDRLTIRVDESTGAKLRVNMSAIARVITGEDSESGSSEKKS